MRAGAAAFLFATVAAAAFVAGQPPEPRDVPPLVYVGDSYFPPFEFRDSNGRPAGYNIQLVEMLASETGRSVDFRLGAWSDAVAAIDSGRADIASMAWSPDRARRYDSVATIWDMHTALLFRSGRARYPTGLDDLQGETLALLEGGWAHERVLKIPPASRPRIRPAADQFQAIRSLLAGEATVVAGNGLALRHIAAQFDIRDLVETPLTRTEYVLVTGKGRSQEFAAWTAAFERLRNSPRMSQLIERTLTVAPPPSPFATQLRRLGAIALGLLGVAAGAFAWSTVLQSRVRARMRDIERGSIERRALADALSSSDARFRAMFESARVGILLFDGRGRIAFANPAAATALRADISELLGADRVTPGRSCFGPDLQPLSAAAEPPHVAARERRSVAGQVLGFSLPGSPERFWLSVDASPILAADGSVLEVMCTVADVTEARRMREERERFFEVSPSLLAVFDAEGRVRWLSPASRRVLGREPAEFEGSPFWDHVDPSDRSMVKRAVQELRQGASDIEIRLKHGDGSTRWTLWNAVSDPVNEVVFAAGLDITERREAERQIQHLAYHDALTGLPNRQLFADRLQTAVTHARRRDEGLAVFFVDLDHFKVINDSLGHSTGDAVLKEIATRLRAALRDEDTVARLGGDEFTALISGLQSPDDLLRIAQKIQSVVRESLHLDGRELTLSASIGVGVFPQDGETAEQLLRNSDLAMYRAKELGRDGVQFYTPGMGQRVIEHLNLETRLRRGLAAGELYVAYQPIVRIATGLTETYEALVRWRDPARGEIPPSDFIAAAEATGLVADIGRFVISRATSEMRATDGAPRVSVNVSVRQFHDPDLVSSIAQALRASGLPADRLEVEITETVAMKDPERADRILHALRDLGVRLWMDDFGTGYSSLSNLRRLPLDGVKIDRSFIADLQNERRAQGIVTAIIVMAHEMELEVVAEGVESEGQLDFLRQHGCDLAQGYLLGRPAPIPG